MPIIRADVVMPYTTNLPRDVTMNTFHFDATEFNGPVTAAIAARLVEVYTTAYGGFTIGERLGDIVSRTTDIATVEMYDLSAPKPRIPEVIEWTVPARFSGSVGNLPLEVAICGSYRATYVSGTPNARRRGRVYFGPLIQEVVAAGDTPRPGSGVRDLINAALEDLQSKSSDNIDLTESAIWGVYSRVDEEINHVTGGWTDNEFDIQRRRGRESTARTLWP